MFTFIKYIYNNLKHQPPILSCREEIERINAEIDKLYAAQEVSLDINKSEDSYIPGGIFFTSQGRILTYFMIYLIPFAYFFFPIFARYDFPFVRK